jgi:hypothetical protein
MTPILQATPGLTIEHDAPLHWLCLTWRGLHSSLAAQHYCAKVLAQVRATGSTKILNDATEDCDGWQEGVPWLTTDFFTS